MCRSLAYSLECTLESFRKFLKNTDVWAPFPEILINFLWGAVWTSEFFKTSQVILITAVSDNHCSRSSLLIMWPGQALPKAS